MYVIIVSEINASRGSWTLPILSGSLKINRNISKTDEYYRLLYRSLQLLIRRKRCLVPKTNTYDGLQGTRCKHKRNYPNKKENTQIKKKPRKHKRNHANNKENTQIKKKLRKQKRKQGTHAKSHSSSQSPCRFLVSCRWPVGERHCAEYPTVSLLVSEVASVAFDGELEGRCSAHAVGQN